VVSYLVSVKILVIDFVLTYRAYSRIRTRTALRSYSRASPRCIGPRGGACPCPQVAPVPLWGTCNWASAFTSLPAPSLSVPRSCYRGTSLIRNHPPLRTTIGPWASAYCRVLGGAFSYERGTHVCAWASGAQPLRVCLRLDLLRRCTRQKRKSRTPIVLKCSCLPDHVPLVAAL
jgi:hypothetical protein